MPIRDYLGLFGAYWALLGRRGSHSQGSDGLYETRPEGLDLINELRAAERFAETATTVEEKRCDFQGLLFWLFKGDFKSVQVLFQGIESCIEAVMVLTLLILKKRALLPLGPTRPTNHDLWYPPCNGP